MEPTSVLINGFLAIQIIHKFESVSEFLLYIKNYACTLNLCHPNKKTDRHVSNFCRAASHLASYSKDFHGSNSMLNRLYSSVEVRYAGV